MNFGVSPTKEAVVIARTAGSGETFVIKSITSIPFQARSGADLIELLRRLVVIFDRGKSRRSTIALLASSSGRFKSSVEAIKAEAITELAAAERGLPVVRVTAASQKGPQVCGGAEVASPCSRAVQSYRPPRELVTRCCRRHGGGTEGR
ncbi:MAG TPA: hypothetical protein VMO26_21145 [Vicinamibacterales bacterium]|nr:hypothetical protein [Vicinamibacterales bacterium]